MRFWKSILLVVMLLVVGGMVGGLSLARSRSVAKFFPEPQVGDIYKFRYRDRDKATSLFFYRKVVAVQPDKLSFMASKWRVSAIDSAGLYDFDANRIEVADRSMLQAIREGRWDNSEHDKTVLVAIERPR
jgi:hypothetical protein